MEEDEEEYELTWKEITEVSVLSFAVSLMILYLYMISNFQSHINGQSNPQWPLYENELRYFPCSLDWV